tara:strand:+ start:1318 stop:1506 length:189 start_codon:yes stop_codon:yes gene_type:complete
MAGNVITQKDLDQIKNEIRTNCAIYTDQVEYGVNITLDAIVELLIERSKKYEVIGLRTVSKT